MIFALVHGVPGMWCAHSEGVKSPSVQKAFVVVRFVSVFRFAKELVTSET